MILRLRSAAPTESSTAVRGSSIALGVCSLTFVLLSSCVVIPHRGKVFGPGGAAGSVDLRFLKMGTTLRDEVRQRLKMVDVGISDEALFWGRWMREWDLYWFAAGAGQTAAMADGGKQTSYRRRNLLIEFDSQGRISALHATGDGDLLRQLALEVQKTRRPGSPAQPELTLVSLEGERISLMDGKISFSGLGSGAPRLECAFASLTALKVASESSEALLSLRLRLEISIPRSFGRRVQRRFSLTPLQLYELAKYADANGLARIFLHTSQPAAN